MALALTSLASLCPLTWLPSPVPVMLVLTVAPIVLLVPLLVISAFSIPIAFAAMSPRIISALLFPLTFASAVTFA